MNHGFGFGLLGATLALVAACSSDTGGGNSNGGGGSTTSVSSSSSSGSAGGGGTGGTGGGSGGTGGTTTSSTTTGPLGADARVLYIHHSTGGVIWGGGVPEGVSAYNTSHAKSYAIEEIDYPDVPYPWANYPYDYWHLWVEGGGQAAAEGIPTLEEMAQDHEVIVFKHCFPVSHIEADSGNPDVSSGTQSIENYKLQYAALKDRLHQLPNKRFLVWTGAALLASESSPEAGARSREFFTWVKGTWDEPGDNIYVWDFFELETEGGNFLLPAHSAGDSHPNDTFAKQVAPHFVQRLVDVIEGRGDTGSLTGQ